MAEYEISPFNEQDKLNDGLLKTTNGDYINIENYGRFKGRKPNWQKFEELKEELGILRKDIYKIHVGSPYELFDSEINKIFIQAWLN